MLHHRGVWWCWKCGHFCSLGRTGRSAPKKLLEPCERRTRAGQCQLNRLARGLHPRRGAEWPDPPGVSIDPLDVLPSTRLWNKTSPEQMVNANLASQPNGVVDDPPDSPHAMDEEGGALENDYDDELGLALPTGLDTDTDDDGILELS